MRITNSVIALLFLALAFSTFESEIVSGKPARTVSSSLSKALLSGDWVKVAEYCGETESLVDSPVLCVIKGHACLALNRNDESFGLFKLVAEKAEDRKVWRQWTADFVKNNPTNSVAHYLNGDALARSGDWNEAISEYSKALKIKADFALALNARGVAHFYLGDFDKAFEDLKSAITIAPDFADALASLGTCLLLKKNPAADGALSYYEQALKCSDMFALAVNGRGCSQIRISTDTTRVKYALVDFYRASQCPYVKDLANSNIQKIDDIIHQSIKDTFHTEDGMTITARDMFEMGLGDQQRMIDNLTVNDRNRLGRQFQENALHSEAWGRGFKYIEDLLGNILPGKIDLGSNGSFDEGRRWRDLMGGTGVDPGVGGVTGVLIEYPGTSAKMLFGLLQQVDTPVQAETHDIDGE